MANWILSHEAILRLSCFFGIFAVMFVWEVLAPKRLLTVSKATRWASNLGIVVLNTLILRLLFPTAAVGIALIVEEHGWGLLNMIQNHFVAEPTAFLSWLIVIIAVIIMDLAIYTQHVMSHKLPLLWQLHRVHHTDLDYDVTTGARFHPLEIIFSMLIKMAVISLLGSPAVAVVIFEVILSSAAMFNHSNIGLPHAVDQVLRRFLVTPDMHRVHHSTEVNETNSNYGFNLAWWDHLFGTYQDQPIKGHQSMVIGLDEYRNPEQVSRLMGMLKLPFTPLQIPIKHKN